MAETIIVRGLRELQAAMRELPKNLDRRILNAALMGGARLMVNHAKASVRVDTGTLRRNIRARPVRPVSHSATVIVGVRKLSKKQIAAFKKKTGKSGSANPSDPYYWRFVEFGTSKMSARPFLRPAFETKKYEAVAVIKTAIGKRIEVEAEKLKNRK